MIVVVNGPLGSGKTSTAWALLERFGRAVMLDGDYVAALRPFDYYNQADLDYAYATFDVLAQHHYAHGIRNIVINWVFESPAQLTRLRAAVGTTGLPLHVVRLRCAPEVLAARIRGRAGPDVAVELRRGAELAAILDAAARGGDMGTVVDTTRLTVDQTVDAIWEAIHRSAW
jgi:broad-specificity NMP kinase